MTAYMPASSVVDDYLRETAIIDYTHPLIQAVISKFLVTPSLSNEERIQQAYRYVRDEIAHSGDIQSSQVTCVASEVLRQREGLCYAKSHLLAALLRAQGIPCGFCYQRLRVDATPQSGYSLHGLNGIFVASQQRWIRADARGNKPGIHAEFSLQAEQVAYTVDAQAGELDFPTIYAAPHPSIVQTLMGEERVLSRIRLPGDL